MSAPADFETIFGESYTSITGSSLDDPVHREEHDAFTARATEEMLDAWTSKPIDPGVSVLSSTDAIVNKHIVHPSQNSFEHGDVELIARVRFLGRTAIDVAKEMLGTHQRFMRSRNQSAGDIYDFFQAYYWHENHRRAGDVNEEEDSFAASPLRLKEWPYGDNINCLGMSIAMAAACEQFGLTYVYANEIRNSQSLMAEQHTEFMAHVRRVLPNFDRLTTKLVLQQVMHARREPDEKYDDILFDTPHILQVRNAMRDFHHFVVCEPNKDGNSNAWVQVDPFDLNYDFLWDSNRLITSALSPLFEKGNENTVVLTDAYRALPAFYRRLHMVLDQASAAGLGLIRYATNGTAHKTSSFVTDLTDRAREIHRQAQCGIFGIPPESESEKQRRMDNDLFEELYTYSLFALSTYVPGTREVIDTARKLNTPQALLGVRPKLEALLAKECEYDPKLRLVFANMLSDISALGIVHIYEYNLKATFQVREFGEAGPVTEFADPEFMIGAMYMNHYATWRKDGRINVARHLSRLCSSQLLWQAARQDEKEGDERIAAMAQVIKKLKPRQLHPLVNIASGIPVPTPR